MTFANNIVVPYICIPAVSVDNLCTLGRFDSEIAGGTEDITYWFDKNSCEMNYGD